MMALEWKKVNLFLLVVVLIALFYSPTAFAGKKKCKKAYAAYKRQLVLTLREARENSTLMGEMHKDVQKLTRAFQANDNLVEDYMVDGVIDRREATKLSKAEVKLRKVDAFRQACSWYQVTALRHQKALRELKKKFLDECHIPPEEF